MGVGEYRGIAARKDDWVVIGSRGVGVAAGWVKGAKGATQRRVISVVVANLDARRALTSQSRPTGRGDERKRAGVGRPAEAEGAGRERKGG